LLSRGADPHDREVALGVDGDLRVGLDEVGGAPDLDGRLEGAARAAHRGPDARAPKVLALGPDGDGRPVRGDRHLGIERLRQRAALEVLVGSPGAARAPELCVDRGTLDRAAA
jgi:hypothetical protein